MDATTRWWAIGVLASTLLAGCGGGGDETVPDSGSAEPDNAGAPTDDDDGDGSITDFAALPEPEIDPLGMPDPGDTRFFIEGQAYDFLEDDAADSAYTCSVTANSITVEYQLAPGLLAVQATNDGDRWQGQMTISPPGSERIYSSLIGLEGTFAVEGTKARYDGDFSWRTSQDPAGREDAGFGSVLITCW